MKTLLTIMFMGVCGYVSAQTGLSVVNDGLRFCESTLPYNNGILVANFGTAELNPLNNEGKGYIMYYKDGKTETFIPTDGNLSAPKGMLAQGDRLFVCDVNKIVVYNTVNKASKPVVITLPEGHLFVNDLGMLLLQIRTVYSESISAVTKVILLKNGWKCLALMVCSLITAACMWHLILPTEILQERMLYIR